MTSRLLTWTGRILLPALFSAIGVPILLVALDHSLTISEVVRDFWRSVLYSLCNGAVLGSFCPSVWLHTKEWIPVRRRFFRALTILLGALPGTLIAALIEKRIWPDNDALWLSFARIYPLCAFLSFLIVSTVTRYEIARGRLETTQIQLQEQALERERAIKLATAARLSSLESRVHPHFLFNTLNSVACLIHEEPKRAEVMVNQFAELLRFSLDSAQGGLVPLEQEMKIVSDYLAIEEARFGNRLRYSLKVPSSLGPTLVPPLVVQTLVENSVKYAVNSRGRGATIRVTADIEKGFLRLLVADDGPGFSCTEIPTGHGLNNLEDRLMVTYGEPAKLHIESSKGGGTVVTVSIPLNIAKAA